MKAAGAIPASGQISSVHNASPIVACGVMVNDQTGHPPDAHWHYGISHPGGESFLQ